MIEWVWEFVLWLLQTLLLQLFGPDIAASIGEAFAAAVAELTIMLSRLLLLVFGTLVVLCGMFAIWFLSRRKADTPPQPTPLGGG